MTEHEKATWDEGEREVASRLDAWGEHERGAADAGFESRVARLSHPVLARTSADAERTLLFEDEDARRGGWLLLGSRGVRVAAGVAIVAAAGFAYLAVRGGGTPARGPVALSDSPGAVTPTTGDESAELAAAFGEESEIGGEIDALFGEFSLLEKNLRGDGATLDLNEISIDGEAL